MQAAAYRDQAELEKLQAQSAAVDREKSLFSSASLLWSGHRGASINSATTQALLDLKEYCFYDIAKIKLMGASKANKQWQMLSCQSTRKSRYDFWCGWCGWHNGYCN